MTLPNAELLCFAAAVICLLLGLFCLLMLSRRRIREDAIGTMRGIATFNFVVALCMLLLGIRVEANTSDMLRRQAVQEGRSQSSQVPSQLDQHHDILSSLRDSESE